ncbi:hypothetical protein [Trichloromonas sp.]|uniref:hypothetical protein n=1 Tax=Trichloromonas sp. TaxID=3069249 RepID=UPI002A4D4F2D|nr:hypothetical protein [Trichloromonas sp.]
MKKILIISAALLLFGTSAFSANTLDMDLSSKDTTGKTVYGSSDDATASTATNIGKTSTGVGVAALSGVNGYALVAQHMNGTKTYGSYFDSTAIYQTIGDVVVGTEADTPTASDSSEFDATTWRAM